MGKNRKYDGKFKQEVIEWMIEHKYGAKIAANEFGIADKNVVLSWMRIYREEGLSALCEERRGRKKAVNDGVKPECGGQESLLDEVKRLRMENDYLKKLQALIQSKSVKKTK
jgi:transposase